MQWVLQSRTVNRGMFGVGKTFVMRECLRFHDEYPNSCKIKLHSNCTIMYTTNYQSDILGIHYLGKKSLHKKSLLQINLPDECSPHKKSLVYRK